MHIQNPKPPYSISFFVFRLGWYDVAVNYSEGQDVPFRNRIMQGLANNPLLPPAPRPDM